MNQGSIKTFEDLDCWQACRELRKFVVLDVVSGLPSHERFRLGDQLIRAARSTTANIAEGYGRFHYLDNAKFCSITRGSACETLDHLITAHDEEMINDQQLENSRILVKNALALVSGYIAYLHRTARQSTSK